MVDSLLFKALWFVPSIRIYLFFHVLGVQLHIYQYDPAILG